MRLIDADELRRQEHCIKFGENGRMSAKNEDWVVTDIDIQNAPTIEVKTGRHGYWVISCDSYYPYCSECTKEPQGRVMTDWCPNCGCRMDEEEKR